MWKKISREVQRTQLHGAVPKEGADSPLMIVFKARAHIRVILLRAFTHFLLQNLQVFSAAPYFWRHMWIMKNIFLYQINWKLNTVLANSLLFTHFFRISEPEQRESRTSAMEGFCIQSEWLPHVWFCTDALVCWWIPSSSLQTAFAGVFGWKYRQEWAFAAAPSQCRGTPLVLWQSAGGSCRLDETRIFLNVPNVFKCPPIFCF